MLKNDKMRERLIPYRILAYLLYTPPSLPLATTGKKPWFVLLGSGRVKLATGVAARRWKVKIAQLWETLWWLEKQGLVAKIEKEKQRGSVIITLQPATDRFARRLVDNSDEIVRRTLEQSKLDQDKFTKDLMAALDKIEKG